MSIMTGASSSPPTVDYAIRKEHVLTFPQILTKAFQMISRVGGVFRLAQVLLDLLKSKTTDKMSVGRMMEINAEKYPNNPALYYQDRVWTHKQLNESGNRLAHYFQSKGIKKGDVVVVVMDSRPKLLLLVIALAKLGAVASLINVNQRGKVLIHSLKVGSGTKFVVGEEMLEAFEAVRCEMRLGEDVELYLVPDHDNKYDSGVFHTADRYLDLFELSKNCSTENIPITRDIIMKDPFAYVFTSGTTGMPKASVIIHYRFVGAAKWFGNFSMNLTEKDVFYVPLPFYHSNGLIVSWGAASANGSAMAMRRKFSASQFWNDTRRYNCTSFVYIGEVCRYLMNQPAKADDRKNPITKMVGNGLRPDIWKSFKERFGVKEVYELYGASEGPVVFTNILNLDCTVGLCPLKTAIVKYDIDADCPIRDPKTGYLQRVQPGEVGLLIVQITKKAPFVGYAQNQNATNKKILTKVFSDNNNKEGDEVDQWFHTGDLLRDIGYGHVQFVDRLGDTFRWKGENVSTTEVEEVINAFEGIEASTVYGVQIPNTDGRAGMMSIVVQEEDGEQPRDDVDMKKLVKYLREHLPPYAVPYFLRIKTKFDTTHTHKIKKTDLKREGFDPSLVPDEEPVYALLPSKKDEYVPLTAPIHMKIVNGEYKF